MDLREIRWKVMGCIPLVQWEHGTESLSSM
jgi:hypothetical protein